MFFAKELMKAAGLKAHEFSHHFNRAVFLQQPILCLLETLLGEVVPKRHPGFLLEFAHEIGACHEDGLSHAIGYWIFT